MLALTVVSATLPAFADDAAPASPATPTAGAPAAPAPATPPAANTTPSTPATPSTPTSTVSSIPIGAYDVLHMDVLSEPDLSKDYIVDPDGDINVPYVGKIRVDGLTTDQAENVITQRLGNIYKNVNLSLTRTAIGGISVMVTGQVQKPGLVSVRRDARLNDVVQILTPTTDADLSKISIQRGLPGMQRTTIGADLQSFLDTGADNGNPPLRDGDVVFVPMKPVAPKPVTYTVSVVGAVPRAGVFQVNPGSTVYDVVTMAGSLGPDADPKGLYLQPANANLPKVPLDWAKLAATPGDATINPVVADGDKIVVPEQTVVYTFSITGAVRNPNTYPIHGSISVLDAVAMAGGLEDGAKPSAATITRVSGTGTTASTIKIDLSNQATAALIPVQPSDHIYIPAGHKGPGLQSGIGMALGVLSIVALLHGL